MELALRAPPPKHAEVGVKAKTVRTQPTEKNTCDCLLHTEGTVDSFPMTSSKPITNVISRMKSNPMKDRRPKADINPMTDSKPTKNITAVAHWRTRSKGLMYGPQSYRMAAAKLLIVGSKAVRKA